MLATMMKQRSQIKPNAVSGHPFGDITKQIQAACHNTENVDSMYSKSGLRKKKKPSKNKSQSSMNTGFPNQGSPVINPVSNQSMTCTNQTKRFGPLKRSLDYSKNNDSSNQYYGLSSRDRSLPQKTQDNSKTAQCVARLMTENQLDCKGQLQRQNSGQDSLYHSLPTSQINTTNKVRSLTVRSLESLRSQHGPAKAQAKVVNQDIEDVLASDVSKQRNVNSSEREPSKDFQKNAEVLIAAQISQTKARGKKNKEQKIVKEKRKRGGGRSFENAKRGTSFSGLSGNLSSSSNVANKIQKGQKDDRIKEERNARLTKVSNDICKDEIERRDGLEQEAAGLDQKLKNINTIRQAYKSYLGQKEELGWNRTARSSQRMLTAKNKKKIKQENSILKLPEQAVKFMGIPKAAKANCDSGNAAEGYHRFAQQKDAESIKFNQFNKRDINTIRELQEPQIIFNIPNTRSFQASAEHTNSELRKTNSISCNKSPLQKSPQSIFNSKYQRLMKQQGPPRQKASKSKTNRNGEAKAQQKQISNKIKPEIGSSYSTKSQEQFLQVIRRNSQINHYNQQSIPSKSGDLQQPTIQCGQQQDSSETMVSSIVSLPSTPRKLPLPASSQTRSLCSTLELKLVRPQKQMEPMIWYAAYDEDMKTDVLFEKLNKITGRCLKEQTQMQSVMIYGYQLCFDSSLSDEAYVRIYGTRSPQCTPIKNLNDPPDSFIYARLYLLPQDLVRKLLMFKGVKGDGEAEDEWNIVLKEDPSQNGNCHIVQQLSPDFVDMVVQENPAQLEEDTMQKIVDENLFFIHFNALSKISVLEDTPVYMITSDQTQSYLDVQMANRSNSERDRIFDTVGKLRRYHLFSRIRDRSGCPSSTMQNAVKEEHIAKVRQILGGIEQAFGPFCQEITLREMPENIETPRKSDIIGHLRRCDGVQPYSVLDFPVDKISQLKRKELLNKYTDAQNRQNGLLVARLQTVLSQDEQESLNQSKTLESFLKQGSQNCINLIEQIQNEENQSSSRRHDNHMNEPFLLGNLHNRNEANAIVNFKQAQAHLQACINGNNKIQAQQASRKEQEESCPFSNEFDISSRSQKSRIGHERNENILGSSQSILQKSSRKSPKNMKSHINTSINKEVVKHILYEAQSPASQATSQSYEYQERRGTVNMPEFKRRSNCQRLNAPSNLGSGGPLKLTSMESRSSQRAQQEREQAVKDLLNGSRQSLYEEKNFDLQNKALTIELMNLKEETKEETWAVEDVRTNTDEANEAQNKVDIDDLSKSLLNSYLNNENIKIQFRNQEYVGGGATLVDSVAESHLQSVNSSQRNKVPQTTNQSSEKMFILHRFNDVQFPQNQLQPISTISQSDKQALGDQPSSLNLYSKFPSQCSTLLKRSSLLQSKDSFNNPRLVELFMDHLLQMSNQSRYNKELDSATEDCRRPRNQQLYLGGGNNCKNSPKKDQILYNIDDVHGSDIKLRDAGKAQDARESSPFLIVNENSPNWKMDATEKNTAELEKQQYHYVFASLQGIMNKLKKEYDEKFNSGQNDNELPLSTSDDNFTDPNQEDFDEHIHVPSPSFNGNNLHYNPNFYKDTPKLTQGPLPPPSGSIRSVRLEDGSSSQHERGAPFGCSRCPSNQRSAASHLIHEQI